MSEPAREITICNQSIGRPGHICAFFDSSEEYYETVIPYFRDGLAAGERVVNIVESTELAEHAKRLADAGLEPRANGLSVLSADDTYLHDGRFEMDRMTEFVRSACTEAAKDCRRVRTAGSMAWIRRGSVDAGHVMEYEARMNLLVPAFDCTFMCVYDLADLTSDLLMDILSTHRYAIVRGRVRENSFYVPPDEYLLELLKRRSRALT